MATVHARRRTAAVITLLLLSGSLGGPAKAAELQPRTIAAFERYVRATERRLDDRNQPFLWTDSLSGEQKRKTADALRRGELFVQPIATRENGREIDIDDGLVHHWIGVIFVPDVTVANAVALLQDYDRHHQIYAPNVARSKTLAREGDRFRVYLRFFMQKGLTVVVNSDHEAVFTNDAPGRVSSRIKSTRIAQVEDPGTPQERELPVGRDGGYLWRLNSYWRFQEGNGGVYLQCESVTLTRGIPIGLGWLVRPFVTSIPRESLTFTMERVRTQLLSR